MKKPEEFLASIERFAMNGNKTDAFDNGVVAFANPVRGTRSFEEVFAVVRAKFSRPKFGKAFFGVLALVLLLAVAIPTIAMEAIDDEPSVDTSMMDIPAQGSIEESLKSLSSNVQGHSAVHRKTARKTLRTLAVPASIRLID
ncbi:hypothetical protein [Serratia nevei]|uniref:hypothetical protein n=1 Tax=Serratia nevei TaxID=2703794 RepID=UPI002550FE43|nr:hypothetical protein [Serratia nevei]MDK5165569.1 hypothetical protein [Serratia nevei]